MSAGQLACMLQDTNMSYVSTRQSSASERIIITACSTCFLVSMRNQEMQGWMQGNNILHNKLNKTSEVVSHCRKTGQV
jgi:hypothetical protein